MANIVSKERRKKTKQREKQAVRGTGPEPRFRDSPVIGLLVGILTWGFIAFGVRGKAIVRYWSDANTMLELTSDAVIILVGLFSTALYLNIVRPEYLRRNSRVMLLCVVVAVTMAANELVLYAADIFAHLAPQITTFLMPFAFAPILVTILLGGRAGVAAGLWVTLAMATRVSSDLALTVVIAGLLASAVAAHGCRLIRKRSKVIRAGAVVGLAQVACVFAATALDWQTPGVQLILLQTLAGLLSALGCAIAALLLLPMFERLFNITTDITLLELSDLSHPLLQRLALEAPGTYHHSLVVATLAQAAADAIGANSLEARVCSYFHDVGKLTKPNYFAENIHMQANPHDDLPPSMSTLVITAHVKEGISLALLHKLPGPVMRAIREHHGSSTLSYFHHKARTQLELGITTGSAGSSGQRVDDSSFRYDGPRPSTKVSAIICLADGVEAASRSLEKTTPGHIEGLVNDIANTRLEDGQLDLCDLKLSELTIVKRTFVFTLSNMLHGRIAYPKDEPKDKNFTASAVNDDPKRAAADTVSA